MEWNTGGMRRFLTSTAVLGSVVGVIGPIRATTKGPRDWRLALTWAAWGIGVAIAIGTVIEESKEIERSTPPSGR